MDTSRLIKGSLAGILVAASLAVAAYAVAPGGVASGAVTDPVDASSAVAARSASGPNEGIKVHGRWVIEVRNADGSVADRREFDNALIGGAHLSALLARTTSVGKWAIDLRSSDPSLTNTEPQPCGSTTGTVAGIPVTTHHPCVIAETGTFTASSTVFETLTVTAPAAGQPNAGALVLSGSATARADASIKKVSTSVGSCAATDAPATTCDFAPRVGMTSTTLAAPVAVTNGQQIQVTVVISFQ